MVDSQIHWGQQLYVSVMGRNVVRQYWHLLGEHPAVEVRGHVVADVHLCEVLVVVHLVLWDTDTLL